MDFISADVNLCT